LSLALLSALDCLNDRPGNELSLALAGSEDDRVAPRPAERVLPRFLGRRGACIGEKTLSMMLVMKLLLTVCAFGLLLSSSGFAEDKSTEQHREQLAKVLERTELQWKQILAEYGKVYRPPVLVLYRGVTQVSCGEKAYSAVEPFYCPVDQKVYLNTSFFDKIATRFRSCVGNKTCQFAQAYLIAHLGSELINFSALTIRS